jgi:undecaprenyl diphosphate synthase
MDGNRRYAKKQGISIKKTYLKSIEVFFEIIDYHLRNGISYASFFALSTENYKKRESEEIDGIIDTIINLCGDDNFWVFFEKFKIKL